MKDGSKLSLRYKFKISIHYFSPIFGKNLSAFSEESLNMDGLSLLLDLGLYAGLDHFQDVAHFLFFGL